MITGPVRIRHMRDASTLLPSHMKVVSSYACIYAVNDSHWAILGVSPQLCLNMWSCKHKLSIIVIDQWMRKMHDFQTQAWNITDLMGVTLKISNKSFIMFMFDSAAPAVHRQFMCISIHPCVFWVFVSGGWCSSLTRLELQSDKKISLSATLRSLIQVSLYHHISQGLRTALGGKSPVGVGWAPIVYVL